MKRVLIFVFFFIVLSGTEKSIEELEQENKILELKLKNERLKKEVESNKKSDKKRTEKIAEVKEILKEVFRQPSKDEKRSGRLWGFGIGGTAMSFQTPTMFGKIQNQSNLSLIIDGQVGGITMWNRYFGVQYYINVDAGFIFESPNFGWSAITSTYTFNADAILNAYNSDSFGIGFLVGLGLGAKYDYVNYMGTLGSVGILAFDVRFNLGLRVIFGSLYALDFMTRFPFLEHESGYTYYGKPLRYREIATFSLRFTMGRF